ncbi:EcKinase 28 [Halyomorpha halys]|nr:EcKinase 28 [Halyomorpha halys]
MEGRDRASVRPQQRQLTVMLISALEQILTTLVADGVFGNVSYLGLEKDETELGASCSADLTFVKMIVNENGKKELPLVVKVRYGNPQVRKNRNLDAQFHNEVVMYKEVIPFLGARNFYPQMFHAVSNIGDESEEDILILENLKYKNFLMPKQRVFLDIDHISVAIKKIAEFHSFSFILKHEDKESFLRMTKKFKDVVFPPEIAHEFNIINAACIQRGIKPLLKDNVSVDLLTNCLSLLKNPFKTRDLIAFPEEPFGVICHGDYCNNNILYKFDENDKPMDCIFFDFQFSTYGSVAIDIFFFLYLNTDAELREKYWDDILKLYWDTLRHCVPVHINIPSYEDFLKHFAERVIYGYTIAAFFLPTMMEDIPYFGNDTEVSTIEEKLAKVLSIGGEKAERKLTEIVLHLLDKDYIRPYIELCKYKKFEC